MDELLLKPIAYIKTDLPEKFGVPRQSGLAPDLKGRIVFEPEYRDSNALRELDRYTHLWLIWGFSENRKKESWEPTVRPPRLGGNTRVGVFASRSPYRPNPIGLTVVKLEGVEKTADKGNVIIVSGTDMTDNTPIYDIKPYLSYVDSIPDASDGFALAEKEGSLRVIFKEEANVLLSDEDKNVLVQILAQDPRPQYQDENNRIYNMRYKSYDVSFTVDDKTVLVLNVISAVND